MTAQSRIFVALAFLSTLALLVVLRVLAGFDQGMSQAVQPLGSSFGDSVASAVTLLGRTDIAVAIAWWRRWPSWSDGGGCSPRRAARDPRPTAARRCAEEWRRATAAVR